MTDDLKPCPWCGGEADAPDGPYGRPVWVYEARCTVCHALGAQADTKADVVSAWNRRPAEDALRARAEAAEQRAEALAAELAQVRADRALLAGLWLAAAPHDVLPALLPTNPGERERLTAALGLRAMARGIDACRPAVRAIIARIVAEIGGGAA